MGRTDEAVERSGVYQSICEHRVEATLTKGLKFPACSVEGSVEWKMIRE